MRHFPAMTDHDAAASPEPERFVVVINHEEQYAIWPEGKPIPEKWREAGFSGTNRNASTTFASYGPICGPQA